MKNLIERFNSINSLKTSLEKEIKNTEYTIQEYSNLLGEKIRTNEKSSSDDPDFLELKAKFDGSSSSTIPTDDSTTVDVDVNVSKDVDSNDKKIDMDKSKNKSSSTKKKSEKKKNKKKGLSDKWYDLNEIHVYNGLGLKGELELYFKAVDETKAKLENLQRCLATLNNVIEKGLKEDMGCIAFRGSDGVVEIAFLKSTISRPNYSLKSIYTGPAIPVENMIKIGV